jgi:hypothetical protein
MKMALLLDTKLNNPQQPASIRTRLAGDGGGEMT